MIIHDIEQNTPEWHIIRLGKPTGSSASSLVTATGKASTSLSGYAAKLAIDLYTKKQPEGWGGNYHTKRGHELEPAAASLYAMLYGRKVEKVGFITSDDEQYGVSPDRLVDDDGLLEIKCLSAEKHVAALLHYKEKRKPPIDYIPQIQMQLFTTGRKWCDLFYYHPDLPECTIRILPNKTFFEMLECQLADVIEKRDEIYEILKAA